jgi:HAD superfamily 5'-nucleotidase-like hydrolase
MLEFEGWREAYGTAPIDLAESRWQFMNTLFSLSEACLYVQLVDLLDAGKLDPGLSYRELYHHVRNALDATHLEGQLKREILAEPERYVVLDERLPNTLMDLRAAGKKLLLITNSEWYYTKRLMSYAFDRFLSGQTWRDLFDIVIVQARKPHFFSGDAPAFRLVDDHEHYTPHAGKLAPGEVYLGGHARLVENSLGVAPDHILYIGDHIFADVLVSKDLLRWRTALIVRELEHELEQLRAFGVEQKQLDEWMHEKALREHELSHMRQSLLHDKQAKGGQAAQLHHQMRAAKNQLAELDRRITELVRRSTEGLNQRWGPLMRCGNDKSHLARQIERYADIYMSRVSNLIDYTPFAYLRAPRVNLPHEVDWER